MSSREYFKKTNDHLSEDEKEQKSEAEYHFQALPSVRLSQLASKQC